MTASLITFRNLSYAYGEGKLRRQVLFDLSGEIRAGEIVVVKGPSGSGKTTLLSLLGALRASQDGAIVILDHRLDGASEEDRMHIRRKIGFVFQLHNLIGALTATQNLLMAIRLHPEITPAVEAAHAMLAAVGLEHALALRPH